MQWNVGADAVRQFDAFPVRSERNERLYGAEFEFVLDAITCAKLVSLHHDIGIRIFIGDLRPAKAPAAAGGHVHAQAEAMRFAHGPAHHLHPLR